MTTEPKLTDEQVDFALKFLDGLSSENAGYLRTPHAEKAVMDRAEEKYRYITFRKIGCVGDCCTCAIQKDVGDEEQRGYGPTRFIALVNALMEARGR